MSTCNFRVSLRKFCVATTGQVGLESAHGVLGLAAFHHGLVDQPGPTCGASVLVDPIGSNWMLNRPACFFVFLRAKKRASGIGHRKALKGTTELKAGN